MYRSYQMWITIGNQQRMGIFHSGLFSYLCIGIVVETQEESYGHYFIINLE